jgi:Cu/Zn superoxide dismutase
VKITFRLLACSILLMCCIVVYITTNSIPPNIADFLVSAAVAEFKGPVVFGVVRLAQVNMELARVEATFSGLSPGKHGWSINQFGDLTRGAESTGNVYNPPDHLSDTVIFQHLKSSEHGRKIVTNDNLLAIGEAWGFSYVVLISIRIR